MMRASGRGRRGMKGTTLEKVESTFAEYSGAR